MKEPKANQTETQRAKKETKQQPQVVKLPSDLIARAKDLIPRVSTLPHFLAVGAPSASSVLRVALSLGLAELEGLAAEHDRRSVGDVAEAKTLALGEERRGK